MHKLLLRLADDEPMLLTTDKKVDCRQIIVLYYEPPIWNLLFANFTFLSVSK